MLLEGQVDSFGPMIIIIWLRYRYHHVLKSIWLDGKHNWWIDHLICILSWNMLLEHYEAQDRAQQIGFEGPDLAKKHQNAVVASARTISLDSIRCVDDAQFHVASQSNLDKHYLVDIQRQICTCLDFPRVRLCKHLCAVKIWYPLSLHWLIFIKIFKDHRQSLLRWQPQLPNLWSCHITCRSWSQVHHQVPCLIGIALAQTIIPGQQWQKWWAFGLCVSDVNMLVLPLPCLALPVNTSDLLESNANYYSLMLTMGGSSQVNVQRQMQPLQLQMPMHVAWLPQHNNQ